MPSLGEEVRKMVMREWRLRPPWVLEGPAALLEGPGQVCRGVWELVGTLDVPPVTLCLGGQPCFCGQQEEP